MAERDAAQPAALEPGEEFAGHRIEAVIGRGGMGVVYRARNLALDRDRALKVIAPELGRDSRFRARFEREARLAASLEHPNVVAVHDAGERDGRLFLAMRLVEGIDLRALVEAEGPLEPQRASRIVSGVAAALDAAHARGLVHRDVKPANVLLEGEGAQERVFLTDFGISRTTAGGETVTASGEIVGSAGFIAPEQVAGEPLDGRADTYALGALAHFALTGEPPFPRESELATLFAHANAPRPTPTTLRPSLPRGVDAAVARAMAVAPAERPESSGAFARELSSTLGGGGRGATAPTARLDRHPVRRRSSAALWAAGAALVTVAVLAALLFLGDDEEPAPGTETGPKQAGPAAPPEPRRLANVPVGSGPTGLAVGEELVWAAANEAGSLVAVDLRTGREEARVPISSVKSVAVGLGAVWAVSTADDSLYEVDPDAGIVAVHPIGADPSDVAVGENWVWVTLESEQRVVRFDPASGETVAVAVGAGPRAVAVGEGAVWVANIEAGSVSKVDPLEPGKVGSEIAVGGRPSDIAVGGGSVWAVDVSGGHLIQIAPGQPDGVASLQGDPMPGFQLPRGVKFAFGAVWVANAQDSTLLRIDPLSGLRMPVRVGEDPADVAVGAGSVWTANEEGGSITRVDPGQPAP